MVTEPLGIYIHIPFCAARCFYCHFVVDLSRAEIQRRYIDAVVKEVRTWAGHDSLQSLRQVDSIYIGGGTPSEIEPAGMERILAALRDNFEITADAEITIEVNPDSLDAQKAQRFREAGINRVSVGVQSFHNDELKRLGRTHTAEEAEQTVRLLRQAKFQNISIDLMAALPGQTVETWKLNFDRVRELRPEHVSLYLFDIDEDSALGRRVLADLTLPTSVSSPSDSTGKRHSLPSEDETIEIYNLAVAELTRLGYHHYEISNFALRQPDETSTAASFESNHNLKYWNLEPYLGLGCAAHSFILPHRWRNKNSTEAYIEAIESGIDARQELEEISPQRLAEDAFIFGLRQTAGIRYDALSCRIQQDAHTLFRRIIDPLRGDSWLIEEDGRLRLAPKALLVSNEIFQRFLNSPGMAG